MDESPPAAPPPAFRRPGAALRAGAGGGGRGSARRRPSAAARRALAAPRRLCWRGEQPCADAGRGWARPSSPRLAAEAAPKVRGRLQPDRHGAAHQSWPCPAAPRRPSRPRSRRAPRGGLEFDLARAGAASATSIVRGLLSELTGAEDATVVNNNAAALLLVLNTLAATARRWCRAAS